MTTNTALWLPKELGQFEITTLPVEAPGPGEILVKIQSCSLNPLDWKIQAHGFFLVKNYPAILGEEAAGIVEALGEGVTKFQKGDRVMYQALITIPKTSGFQQYSVIAADQVTKVPDSITLDQAATLLVCIAPAAISFYLPPPAGFGYTPIWEEGGRGKYADEPILIFGGASGLGQSAIQFARMSGFSPIITTASQHNFPLLTSLGATHIIDRHLPLSSLAAEVRKITSLPIKLVFDSISHPETQQAAYDLLPPNGKLVITVPKNLKEDETLGKTVIHVFGSFAMHNEARAKLYGILAQWLENGDLKPNNVEIIPGGLKGIPTGLERLKNDQVSGKRLVARPWETA